VVVGSGDVCRANLSLTLDDARKLVSEHGPVGRWLWDEFQAWYYRFVKPMRSDDLSKPWVIWDIITLAYEEGMTTEQSYPRPVLTNEMSFDHLQTPRTITWITGVDSKRLWADFVSRLDLYERTHSMGESSVPPFLP
jgi:purine nucleosidase